MAETETVQPDKDVATANRLPSSSTAFEDFIKQQSDKTETRSAERRTAMEPPLNTLRDAEREAGGLKPPEPVPLPPKPELQFRDPMQAFGSAAGWLAVFGGFLTKRPLQTSLNAAAGVMNAWRARDNEVAQYSLKEWEGEIQNAKNLHQFQMDQYNGALAKLKDRRADAVAELQAIAAAYKDETAGQLIEARMYGQLQQHLSAVDRMFVQLTKNGPDEWMQAQREALLKQIEQARASKDPEQVQSAQQAMADFNRIFPQKGGAAIVAADAKKDAAVAKADKITSAFETWRKSNPANAEKDLEEFIPIWQRLNGTLDPEVKAALKAQEIDARKIAKDAVSSAWRTYHEVNPTGSWEEFVKSYQELHGTMSPADKKALKEQEIEARKETAKARPQSVDQRAASQFEKETQAAQGRPPNAAEWQKFKQGLSVAQSQKAQSKAGQFDLVEDSIDEAIAILDGDVATAAGVAGLGGYIDRPLESVLTAIGYQDSAPAHLFQHKIDTIKTMVPRLLTSSAKTAKDERERLDTIVSGLKMGQSAKIARQNLTELKDLLIKIKQKEFGDTGGYTSPEDVKAAVAAGTIDKDAGLKILREKFGFQ